MDHESIPITMNDSPKGIRPGGYPMIEAVPPGTKRPLFSVMIPAYDPREEHLEKTLRSVLDQDLGPEEMQMEVLEDGSTNGVPEKTIQGLSTDRVSVYRQGSHLGISRNWTACIRRARGSLVHILHQDDLVLPGFYRAIREVFEREPEIGAAFCQFVKIDKDGNWLELSHLERSAPGVLPDWLERIAVSCAIQCPAVVVKRSVYEELGGFHPDLAYALDWEMWKRIAAKHPFGYVPKPLACYRVHDRAETSRLVRTGADSADVLRSIAISRAYLPESRAARLTREAREDWALHALTTTARDLFLANDAAGARNQVRESLRCSRSPRVLYRTIRLLLWAAARRNGSPGA